MNGTNDYWTGPHHFWTHFWCGLILGAGPGGRVGWRMFGNAWATFATLIVAGLAVGYSCGRYGDKFWHRLIRLLWWYH